MARKKNEMKAKEPVKLRFKKLSNANLSIYLDIYYKGKRYYEFLKLYLTPERFPEDRDKNRITWPIVSRHNGSLIFRTRFTVSV